MTRKTLVSILRCLDKKIGVIGLNNSKEELNILISKLNAQTKESLDICQIEIITIELTIQPIRYTYDIVESISQNVIGMTNVPLDRSDTQALVGLSKKLPYCNERRLKDALSIVGGKTVFPKNKSVIW